MAMDGLAQDLRQIVLQQFERNVKNDHELQNLYSLINSGNSLFYT